MTTLAVTSVSSLLCQASTCFRIGSKLRCIRSTPTEMQSMSENDFECFASTGVNTPVTMSPSSWSTDVEVRGPDSSATNWCPGTTTAEVQGLNAFPKDQWPTNIPLLYFSYHVMV